MSFKDRFMEIATPELLSRHKDRLLEVWLDRNQPPKPINEVDDNTLSIGTDFSVIRNWGCTFAFLLALFLGGSHLMDIRDQWKGYERTTIRYINRMKIKHGQDHCCPTVLTHIANLI